MKPLRRRRPRPCADAYPCRHQHGATLLITLTMLVFMLLLATASAQLLMLDQHGARHWRGQVAARLAAQAALDGALHELRAGQRRALLARRASFPGVAGCHPTSSKELAGLCLGTHRRPTVTPAMLASNNAILLGRFSARQAPGRGHPTDHASDDVPAPRYLIELVGNRTGAATNYRLAAIGFGPHGARVMLQASVQRLDNDGQVRFVVRNWLQLHASGQTRQDAKEGSPA